MYKPLHQQPSNDGRMNISNQYTQGAIDNVDYNMNSSIRNMDTASKRPNIPLSNLAAAKPKNPSGASSGQPNIKKIKKVKPAESESVESKNLCCSTCGFQATNKNILQHHMNTKHVNKKKFDCTQCSYKTTIKFLFDKHVKTH